MLLRVRPSIINLKFLTAPRAWKHTMATTNIGTEAIKFGPYEVTNQVFLKTPHSFALVNLKPLITGHILVCPLKSHRRLTDLSGVETGDLFETVQLTQRLLTRLYFPRPEDPESGSFNVALQDGREAGQTVPHVHVHVIPRIPGDMARADDVYVGLAAEASNVGGALWDRERPRPGGEMPRIEDEDRRARTTEEMDEEAERYRVALREMGIP